MTRLDTVINKMIMVRWSMWLSHHPPCDYDHTYSVYHLRLCTRCTAIIAGVLFDIIFRKLALQLPFIGLVFVLVIAPLPAVVDFLSHEAFCVKSNNLRRAVTGFMLGIASGLILVSALGGNYLTALLGFCWIISLELLVMFVMRHKGVLEGYAERYEKAVIINRSDSK